MINLQTRIYSGRKPDRYVNINGVLDDILMNGNVRGYWYYHSNNINYRNDGSVWCCLGLVMKL